MIKEDENALICDLAETYQIYDYKRLPPSTVAVFVIGLRNSSRIKMKLSGQIVPLETLILAGVFDRLNFLAWTKTRDSQKGINRPNTILDFLTSKTNNDGDVIIFNSGKDFEKKRNELIKAGGEYSWQLN